MAKFVEVQAADRQGRIPLRIRVENVSTYFAAPRQRDQEDFARHLVRHLQKRWLPKNRAVDDPVASLDPANTDSSYP